jgi:hypothetical protein
MFLDCGINLGSFGQNCDAVCQIGVGCGVLPSMYEGKDAVLQVLGMSCGLQAPYPPYHQASIM